MWFCFFSDCITYFQLEIYTYTDLQYYNSLAYHLHNIIYIWHFQVEMRYILQSKGARMHLNCDYRTHIRDMLNERNWITVKERADFHSTCLIYKCQNNLAPQYFVDHFNNISESHNFNTRNSTHRVIKLANPSNNQLLRTFKYNGAKLWNALAIYVRGKPSLNSFKSASLKYFFTHR